jgi:SAM-dependent methyltransferase
MNATTTPCGSAHRCGALWGARAADWALSEDRQVPTYEAALQRVVVEPGDQVLDIGCGVGAFLRLAAGHGAEPHGIDASEALVAFARTRLPGADLRVGEMEDLPWRDDSFDVVTGFNSFFSSPTTWSPPYAKRGGWRSRAPRS